MANADQMLEHAAEHAAVNAAPGLSPRPGRRVAVVACMDARIDVFSILGIARGDAHVIRNAGGIVTDDVLRSLSTSQRLLDTEEVIILMHDGCGLHGASDDEFAATLRAEGAEPEWALGGFEDTEETMRGSLERLRNSPELVARDQIRGFIFDPENGQLREVTL